MCSDICVVEECGLIYSAEFKQSGVGLLSLLHVRVERQRLSEQMLCSVMNRLGSNYDFSQVT